MKKWMKPEAVIQQFVANDYVAACNTHYAFECNVPAELCRFPVNKTLSFQGKTQWIKAMLISPCGFTHYVEKDNPTNVYDSGTITQHKVDGVLQNFETPFNVYVWYDYSDDMSTIEDTHATVNDMSTWETTKS